MEHRQFPRGKPNEKFSVLGLDWEALDRPWLTE